MTKFCVTSASTVSEPRTAASATASFARFLDGATFRAYRSACCRCRRRACWCPYACNSQRNSKTVKTSLFAYLFVNVPTSALNLRSQAFRPSNHLCSTFLLPGLPQFLYQAPPGAQQLTRPDFSNVPHFGHVIISAIVKVMDGVLIGVLVMSSRSMIGRCGTY